MKKITKRQWISFSIWCGLYLLFMLWMGNPWLLLGVPVIVDIFLTKFIPWGAWKKSKNPKVANALSWVEDILFALVAVYLINIFIFQNYQIPTSSLEKTLLVGDSLFVSKLSYGPRVPNTPISFPLVQNTLPIINTKSYIEWPRWGYKRVKGLGQVERNDIVVFNFPPGDTIALKVQNPDYYGLCKEVGREAIYLNPGTYGKVIYRPVDKRENFVKRCVGMPGDSLMVRNNQLIVNGVAEKDPKYLQYKYFVETNGSLLTEEQFRVLGVSNEDRRTVPSDNGRIVYLLPLTKENQEKAKKLGNVTNVQIEPDYFEPGYDNTYPLDYNTGWTRDNYGPLWIPKKGATVTLDPLNLALYRRCIVNYEGNELEEKNDGIYINGTKTNTFTFKYDYYFMMGDNRHNSADSRSWGFVPEDHIVGKPIMVWLSLDKDRGWFDGKIRWRRMFRKVDAN